jgi:hypothetical protein
MSSLFSLTCMLNMGPYLVSNFFRSITCFQIYLGRKIWQYLKSSVCCLSRTPCSLILFSKPWHYNSSHLFHINMIAIVVACFCLLNSRCRAPLHYTSLDYYIIYCGTIATKKTWLAKTFNYPISKATSMLNATSKFKVTRGRWSRGAGGRVDVLIHEKWLVLRFAGLVYLNCL